MGYVLTCCSAADLSKRKLNQRQIPYLCFRLHLGGQEYLDDLGDTVYPEELYRRMLAGEDVSTAPASVEEYVAFFEEFLKVDEDILHISLSSGISDAYAHACEAGEQLRSRYPERTIYISDSLGASTGYGMLVESAADLRDSGMELEALYQWVESNKLNLHHWFFSTDLSFYVKGGRISKAAAFVGSAMDMCPLLNVDATGRLVPVERVHTKKNVIKEIVRKMEENAQNGLDYSGKCYLCHSVCPDDARAVASLVERKFHKLDGGRVEIYPVGVTIGSHTGPRTLALFFYGNERTV